jgi:hypothetical protein
MKRTSPRYQRLAAGGFLVGVVLAFVALEVSLESEGERAARHRKTPWRIGEMPEDKSSKRREDDAREIDPSLALMRAFALEKGSDRDVLVRELLSGWAARDAEAALGWVSSMKDPEARRSARAHVCLAVAEEDPPRALGLALAHDADEDGGPALLECLAMQWCEKQPATAIEWAREQPPGEWRDRLLARTSAVLSRLDPAAAGQLVSGLEPGDLQDEAVMAVLHQWALKDPAAALEWAEAFSESALRDRALVEIANLRKLTAAAEVSE